MLGTVSIGYRVWHRELIIRTGESGLVSFIWGLLLGKQLMNHEDISLILLTIFLPLLSFRNRKFNGYASFDNATFLLWRERNSVIIPMYSRKKRKDLKMILLHCNPFRTVFHK